MTDTDTLIEKYLYKELSEAEVQEFEQRMESDTDFADEVELRSVIFAKTKSDFKQQLKAAHQKAEENPIIRPIVKLTPLYYLKRIAAVLILGVFVFLLYRSTGSSDTADMVTLHIAQTHTAPTTLLGENDNAVAWKAAKNAYQKGDYKATATEIEKITSPDTEQQFYLALAYLYNKNYDKSIAKFESIIQQNNINYSPTSKWYVSLAYLKNNQAAAAKKYLQEIVKDKSWKYQEAQNLLNKLPK